MITEDNFKHADITDSIIKCFYTVYNKLGYGFLEKVYENALKIELIKIGYSVETQKPIIVYYDNVRVGEYYADLVVNELVILELKACESLNKAHENQLLNYLRATNIEVGLLLNFGEKPVFSRRVFDNGHKNMSV